jgi:hypothetical protein
VCSKCRSLQIVISIYRCNYNCYMNDNVMDIICILVIPISNIIMFYVSFWWDLIRGSCPVVLTISHSIVKLKRQR